MAKITKKQISEKDPFGEVKRSALSAKESVVLLENSIKMLSGVAKNVRGSLKGLTPKNTASINKINQATQQSNTIAKQREQLQRKLNIANSDAIQKNVQLNEQLKIQRKTNVRLAKEKLGLISLYSKESKKLIDLRNKYKDLALQNKQNTREGRALLKNITRLDKKLKKVDATVGQHQRNVGNYGKALGRLRGRMVRLAGAFGFVGGIALFARAMRNSFNKIVEFQKANTVLASVLGKTRSQIKSLTGDAKRLGSSTVFTATQVSGLQKEFAKLGFTTGEILGATEATLNLAVAAGTELPRAAEVVGNTLRAFGLETSDTTELVDVMTKSFNTSALDMEKFSTGMATVAPVAANAGLSIQRTTAILGTLANNGVDASTAGTGLRNILLDLTKHGLTFQQAMTKINKSTNKTGTAFKLFGKRGATVATIVADNTENIKELDEALENAGGTAQKVADEQMDTLKGSMAEATSAWEGFIFSMESGDGVISQVARSVVDSIASVLKALTNLNKTSLDILADNIAEAAKAGQEVGATASGVQGATFDQVSKSVEQLNDELKITAKASTGIFTDEEFGRIEAYNQKIIDLKNGGLSDLQIKLKLVEDQQKGSGIFLQDESRQTRDITDLNIELEKMTENAKLSFENLEKLKQGTIGGRIRTNVRAGVGMDELEEDRLIRESDERVQDAMDRRGLQVQRLAKDIGLIEASTQQANKSFGKLIKTATDDEILQLLKETNNEDLKKIAQLEQLNRSTRQLAAEEEDGAKKGSGRAKEVFTRLKELQNLLKANRLQAEIAVTENTEASDLKLISLNKEGSLLTKQIKTIKELLDLKDQDNSKLKEKIAMLGAEFEAEKKLIAADPNVRGQDDRFFDEAKIKRDLEIEQSKIRLGFLKDELKLKEELLMENFDTESVLFKESQELRLERIKLENKIRTLEFNATQEDLFKQEADLEAEFLDRKLNGRLSSAEEIAKAEAQFEKDKLAGKFNGKDGEIDERKLDAGLDKLNQVRVGRKKETDEEILEAENQLNRDLIDLHIKRLQNRRVLLKKESLEYKELTKEIFELQVESNEIGKDETENLEHQFELRRSAVTVFTDFFIAQSDKRIAKIDEEIAAAQRQADLLAGLAQSGNITARESLAEQDRIIAEANLRKEREEKRKQRILLVSSILEAYNNELEGGAESGEAFTKAITSTAVLQQFIAALPTFLDGIEDTGIQGQGVDGKGGFHAILHPNERVMTKGQNKSLEGYSNDEVAAIVEQYRYGAYMNVGISKGSDNGNQELKNELALVRKAIEDKPEQVIELGRISQAAMTIRETVRKGNRVTTNTFKVN